MTLWRIWRKRGFSWNVLGMGGTPSASPRASSAVGGSVGRRLKMCDCLFVGLGKTYFKAGQALKMY